jgi:hypothetical protein
MGDIAKLLFGRDADRLLDLFTGDNGDLTGDNADGFGMADRARRAGEWCGSTPGAGSAAGAARPHGTRRQVIVRKR